MELIREADLQWVDVPGLEGEGARMADVTTSVHCDGMATGLVRMEDVTITRRLAYAEIVHVLSGRMEVRTDDGEVAVAGPGDTVFLPKGGTQTCIWREPTLFFFAITPADWRAVIETPLATA